MAPAAPRQLSGLIEQLVRGEEPALASLATFSDLGREESAQLREAWASFPLHVRTAVVGRAVELSEESVDLDFTQLGLIALDDESPEVRGQAAESLSESPQRAVASGLLAALRDDPDDDVRRAAADALRQFVVLREFEQFESQLGDAIVVALGETFEDATNAPLLRANALESLGVCSLPWVADLIAEGYADDDRDVRLAALVAMGDSADERWLDYIVEQFYSEDPEFRFSAVLAAAQLGSEDAVEPLAALLADEDPEVVLVTIAAIGEIGGDQALEVLLEYAENAPPEVEEVLAEAMQTAAEFASGDDGDDDYEDELEE